MCLVELRHIGFSHFIESCGGEDQDRGVDGQCKHQCDRGINRCELNGFTPIFDAVAETPRLHHARMQIEIVRHHRGADDANREIEHVRVTHDLGGWRKAADHCAPVGIGHRDLHDEAECDYAHQSDNECLDPAEAKILHPEDQKYVERRNQHADLERNAEQQVEADCGTDHFCKI